MPPPDLNHLYRTPVRLAPWHRHSLYGVMFVLTVSGLAWVGIHYLLPRGGLNEPLLPASGAFWMKLHGAAAMLALYFLGSLLLTHIRRAWILGRNRISGLFLAGVILFLALSGYGLYYLGDEHLRDITSLSHWIAGTIMATLLVTHILLGRRDAPAVSE